MTRNQTDYILVHTNLRRFMMNFRADNSASLSTDHALVMATPKLEQSKVRWNQGGRQSKIGIRKPYDVDRLVANATLTSQFTESLKNHFAPQ